MTTLVVLLGFLVLAVVGLGVGLWRAARLDPSRPRMEYEQPTRRTPCRGYLPMARLFDDRDLDFLRSQRGYRPAMSARLRRERRQVLMLYMGHLRTDFRVSWTSYRAAARSSDNPELAWSAIKQYLSFYTLYAALQLQCLLGLFVYVRADSLGLLNALQRLQRTTRRDAEKTDLQTAPLRGR